MNGLGIRRIGFSKKYLLERLSPACTGVPLWSPLIGKSLHKEGSNACPCKARNRARLILSLILPLLFSVLAIADDGSEFSGRRLTRVDILIEDLQVSATNEMRSLLDVAPGQTYSPVRIHDSLIKLYRSGLVSNARVEALNEGTDGVALRFVVTPQARIDTIIFEGEPIFSVPELRSRLNNLEPGTKLSTNAVNRGLDELLAYYSARGFNDAKVAADVRLEGGGTRASVVYTIAPGEQAKVAKITTNIVGAHLDLSSIKHTITEGQSYTQVAVQEEMERIRQEYLKNNYLNVRVSNKVIAGGGSRTVNVILDVEAGARIVAEVQGLEIKESAKHEIFPFYTQGGVDEFTIEEGRLRLLEYAQRQGYFFAQVQAPALPESPDNVSNLVYTVETGQKYVLTEINIEGVTAISRADLLAQMKSKISAGVFLANLPLVGGYFGSQSGYTSNDFLRQDANLIAKRLKELGYRRARVEERRGIAPDSNRLIITFSAVEGPRTYIEQIGFRGNEVTTADALNERLSLRPDAPLLADNVRSGADSLLSEYNGRGYATAEINAEVAELGTVEGQERVRLIYNINEGNRVRIRDIITRGTVFTDPKRLEHNFYLFKRGDWLSVDKTLETERALYDTNAFSSVTITSDPVTQTPDGVEERNVTVNVVEAKRNLLIYGGGFQFTRNPLTVPGLGFLNGVRGSAQITNTNLFGKLYTGSLLGRVGRDEALLQASFQNPRPFGVHIPVLISLLGRNLAEQTFRSSRYTTLIQLEKRFTQNSIGYIGYNFERVKLFDLQVSEDEIDRNNRAIRLGRVGPSYARDTRDNSFEPTTGSFTIGSFSLASKYLGGSEEFNKLVLEHTRYYRINDSKETVYSVTGRVGLSAPYGGKDTLPISERFFAGGSRDLRGFGFEEAGPKDPVTGRPVGGNGLVVINNELRFPIRGIFGGTIFSDLGNVFRRVRDIDPGKLTLTVGFGFRIKTPIGPVRFDIGGLVWNKPAGAPQLRGHFTFGQTF